ncbi:MAG: hypothetical protein AB8B62_19495 [Roseobacter sp.]
MSVGTGRPHAGFAATLAQAHVFRRRNFGSDRPVPVIGCGAASYIAIRCQRRVVVVEGIGGSEDQAV